jgi:hypothetical protein
VDARINIGLGLFTLTSTGFINLGHMHITFIDAGTLYF